MKKTLLISALSVALACMPLFQVSANSDKSALEKEITEIVEQVKDFNKKHPAISEDGLKIGSIGAGLGAAKFLIPFMPTFGKSLRICPVRGCVGAVLFKSAGLYLLNGIYVEREQKKTLVDKAVNLLQLNAINKAEKEAKQNYKNSILFGAGVVGFIVA